MYASRCARLPLLLRLADLLIDRAGVFQLCMRAESSHAAVVEHEKAIYMAQAAESGKPEAIQEKMATGRLEKFFKESTLTEQAFVKNPDQSVNDYTAEVAKNLGGEIKIVSFVSYERGEGLEKREDDFAAEIDKLVKGQ